jgi:hypothetical protein
MNHHRRKLWRVETLLAVGGPRLDALGGGWDAWPIVGIVMSLWIGRRILRISWGAPLLIAALVASLALPPVIHAWGVVTAAGVILGLTIALLAGRASGSAKRTRAV